MILALSKPQLLAYGFMVFQAWLINMYGLCAAGLYYAETSKIEAKYQY